MKRGEMLVFWDESGFSTRPSIRRTWGPRGRTPILRERYAHWEHLSALGALTISPDLRRTRVFLSLSSGSVKSETVVEGLRSLRRHVRGSLLLLWDRLGVHRSRTLREHLEKQQHWLRLDWFPAYAPELNPVEYLWAWLDSTALANFCPDDTQELARQVRRGTRRLQRHPDVTRAFLKHSGLFPEL